MREVPLSELANRLTANSWRMLELIEAFPQLSKKELYERFGDGSRNKFDSEYSRLYGSCLIEEKKASDTRYLMISLTEYGREILKLNPNESKGGFFHAN